MENAREQSKVDRAFRAAAVLVVRVDGTCDTVLCLEAPAGDGLTILKEKLIPACGDPNPGEPEFLPRDADRH